MTENAASIILRAMESGVADGVFPGGVVLWGTGRRIMGEVWAGRERVTPPEPFPAVSRRTVYDLASLTKPLVTAALALIMVSGNRFTLETPLSDLLEECRGTAAGNARVREILSHSSGLCAWAPLYEALPAGDPGRSRKNLLERILALPSAGLPGEKALYSDFGYILLGMGIERVAGLPLEILYRSWLAGPLEVTEADFLTRDSPLLAAVESGTLSVAPTEVDPASGRPFSGVVHDEHARLMGGVSGHAGLFGTARAVWQLSRIWMDGGEFLPPVWVDRFRRRQGSLEWALGWDTPTPGSSGGQFLTPDTSIGHLGYAGTSVWMDWRKDRMVVLLTNRVHPARTNNRIRSFRPFLHDTVMTAAFSP